MFLWGIATDGFGNVYVTCRNSNNVLVVSPDGQHHEKLVCRRNGLIFPTGIYFDSSINGLLTCNEIGGLVMCTKIYDAAALLHDDSLQLTTRLLDKIKVNGNLSSECYKASEYLHITDCTMIGKFIILLDSYNKRLIIHDEDGTDNRDIKLTGEPQNISPINDNDLAVTSSQSYIEIISINTAQIKNLIGASGDTYGISYHNGLLYVVIDRTKIDVMNLRGEISRSFTLPSSKVWDLTTYKNRLFFADVFEEILYCFDLNGVVIWKFNCDKMKSPNEVTTDQNGNVYVTCSVYNNVVVVSSDGKHYKELFNKKDGLRKPTGIYYDKSTNNLLVCNAGDDYALIFDIKQ
ncbi:Hypothetical predicted protein [Mytilus galloprovincialis]|uniref:Uncharacterized protein n=1 Tax=Mytilus galloprovincialis TaxID=29158 RepID=A0A8B6E350_MYTGA|nr:Hypothetical predicted protein [Mytilus galloprovincialis]